MSAAANKLLDRIEQMGLLEDNMIADLRRKVTESGSGIAPDKITKLLVERGYLTAIQAKKLLADLESAEADEPKKPAAPAAKPADDDLGLASFDDEPAAAAPPPKAPAPKAPEPKAPEPKAAEKPTAPKEAKPKAEKPKPAPGLSPLPGAPAPGLTPLPGPAAPGLTPIPGPPAPSASPFGPPAAGPGLTPLGPAAGLQPLSGGLQPMPGGLQPLDAGLVPLGGPDPMAGGMQAMDPISAGGMGGIGGPMAAAAAAQPSNAVAAAEALKKARRQGWDSPLMLMGGGGLILLLIAGVVLVFILARGDAKQILDQANADYQAQSYTNSIAMYEKLLKNFPKDPKASFARVRIGLASLRKVTEGTRELKVALATAKEVIPKIENEEDFGEARPELAGILPEIALGLSQQARGMGPSEEGKAVVQLADDALELVKNPAYIPTSLRTSQQQRIDEIERVLGEAKRSIQQEDEVVKALADISASANSGQTGDAFERRRSLLKLFPSAEADPRLAEAVQQVAAKEKTLVQISEQPTAAAKEDHPEPADVRRVLISHRRGEKVAGVDNQTVFFLAAGSVYGLDATTGQLLWRRFVGFETRQHPQPLSKDPGADALLVDGSRQELVRVAARTGQLVWRLPVGERFANPALVGNRILLATETGQLWDIDSATGQSARRVKFPQGLPTEPGPMSAAPHTYQVGMHSHIYTLASDSLGCAEVYYLGHRPGTVMVPPVVTLNHVFVAENAGPDYSLLHVLAVDEKGLNMTRPAELEPIRMAGHIITPLVQVRNRVLAVTTLGEARVVEIDPGNKQKPAKIVGSLVKTSNSPIPAYPLFDYAQLWIGADRFVAYDVQASRAQINRKWIKHEQEFFVAPHQVLNKTIFHARRRRGSPGVSITAAKPDDGAQIWRTDLAVPLTIVAGDPERKQITAVSAQGDLFRLAKDAFDAGILDQPIESAEVEGSATTFSFTETAPLGGGRHLLMSDVDRASLLVYDPSRMGDELLLSKADAGTGTIVAMPQAFAGAALLPLDNGQVALVDPTNGKPRALPFQPRLEPGLKVRWTRPSVFGGDQPEFVIADNRQRIYRVALKDQPNLHLALQAEAELPGVPVAPVAANSDAAYFVMRTPEGDAIHPLVMPDFAAHAPVQLKGRVVQGPWSIENQVLLVTDVEGLVALGSDHQVKWTAPLPSLPIAGTPRIEGDSILLATRLGVVLKVGLVDGKPQGQLNLGSPLFNAPSTYGNRLLIGGSEGAFYALPGLVAP